MDSFNWDRFSKTTVKIFETQYIRDRININNLGSFIVWVSSDELTFFTWLVACKYFGLEKDFLKDYKKLRKVGNDIGVASTHAGLGWIK
jgi:hypothetical protein